MNLTAESTALLVQKALVLEPLADKRGCTSRHIDLPGRPLESFVLAGINVGPVFREYSEDWLAGGEKRLFHHFVRALEASSEHASGKYVNFGLLEILFPTVAARLICNDPDKVVATIIQLMREAPQSDVTALIQARELGWKTSEKRAAKLADLTPTVRRSTTPFAFYEALLAKGPYGSTEQWVRQYQQGLPLLAEQFDLLRSQKEGSLLDKIANAYNQVYEQHSDIRVGILADMCAAAIFLYLSYYEDN